MLGTARSVGLRTAAAPDPRGGCPPRPARSRPQRRARARRRALPATWRRLHNTRHARRPARRRRRSRPAVSGSRHPWPLRAASARTAVHELHLLHSRAASAGSSSAASSQRRAAAALAPLHRQMSPAHPTHRGSRACRHLTGLPAGLALLRVGRRRTCCCRSCCRSCCRPAAAPAAALAAALLPLPLPPCRPRGRPHEPCSRSRAQRIHSLDHQSRYHAQRANAHGVDLREMHRGVRPVRVSLQVGSGCIELRERHDERVE